ncbi:MAG TPA: ABC transporter ATP-binding protein [Lachnospiraceae bacterium]|nr:ABC transporter ATP-binding protein [Lachnospiraceae bacterium]
MEILSVNNVVFRSMIRYTSINILPEEVTFIQGESGCGKSTLLKLFNATLTPDRGEILYKGTNLEKLDTITLRQEVMLVGQSVFLFSGSIEDNFREFYRYRGRAILSREEIERFLRLCCADFSLDTACDTMSGGERQRVYLAIFLSFLPKVLLLDEPTSALDGKTAKELMTNLTGYCKEQHMTLVVVSHDSSLAKEYAEHIIYMEKDVLACREL